MADATFFGEADGQATLTSLMANASIQVRTRCQADIMAWHVQHLDSALLRAWQVLPPGKLCGMRLVYQAEFQATLQAIKHDKWVMCCLRVGTQAAVQMRMPQPVTIAV